MKPDTIVINVSGKRYEEWLKVPNFVYVGRKVARRGFPASDWKNPHILKSDANDDDRKESIEKYRRDLLDNAVMLRRIPELRCKMLGCWCKPKHCHGDVLKELAELQNEELLKIIEKAKDRRRH